MELRWGMGSRTYSCKVLHLEGEPSPSHSGELCKKFISLEYIYVWTALYAIMAFMRAGARMPCRMRRMRHAHTPHMALQLWLCISLEVIGNVHFH